MLDENIDSSLTLQNIHTVAKNEFLEKGFQGASLRKIVSKAGVTTGAFYGYYKSKEELFEALVKDFAEYILKGLRDLNAGFQKLSAQGQIEYLKCFIQNDLSSYFDYMLTHKLELELLIKCSAGTKYGDFAEKLAKHEESSTKDFIRNIEKLNPEIEKIDSLSIKFISTTMVHAILEPLMLNLSQERVIKIITQIQRFYELGWVNLVNSIVSEKS